MDDMDDVDDVDDMKTWLSSSNLPLESQGLHPGDAAVPMVRAWTDAGHGVGLPRMTWVRMVKGAKTRGF